MYKSLNTEDREVSKPCNKQPLHRGLRSSTMLRTVSKFMFFVAKIFGQHSQLGGPFSLGILQLDFTDVESIKRSLSAATFIFNEPNAHRHQETTEMRKRYGKVEANPRCVTITTSGAGVTTTTGRISCEFKIFSKKNWNNQYLSLSFRNTFCWGVFMGAPGGIKQSTFVWTLFYNILKKSMMGQKS